MLEKLFRGHTTRKFNYIPRFYDTKNNDLVNRRLNDSKFAQAYVRKKKMAREEMLEEEKRIDFSSYKIRSKRSKRSPQFNTFLILVGLLLILLVLWLITTPGFTNIFEQ